MYAKTTTLLALAMLAVAVPVAALAAGLPASPATAIDRYLVGFFELPADRASYHGFPVVAVDTDLKFLVVRATDGVALEAAARLDDAVRYLEPDNPFAATASFVPNDALYGNAGN